MGDPRTTVPEIRLSDGQQRRNVAVYVITNSLIYLAAPVVYVGITQASLCSGLGASDTVSNLPASAAYWGALLPLFVVCLFQKVSHIRGVLAGSYAALALGGIVVTSALYWPVPNHLRIAAVVFYGALVGGSLAVVNTFLWELVGRGIGEKYRGVAYGLAFGVGPLLAVLGSLGQQMILAGRLSLPWVESGSFRLKAFDVAALAFPLNFALLFGISAVIMGWCALVSLRYVVPEVEEELPRINLGRTIRESVRELRTDRVLLLSVLAYLLMEAGATISNNLSLYTPVALGQPAEDFNGYQNALRFAFKVGAGLLIGWVITRTNPRMGLLLTGLLCLAGAMWPLLTSGYFFLLSFGLMGAGELYGVYYPNYVMTRSRPDRIRPNMAFVQLLLLISGLAPPLFGLVSDHSSLRASFVLAGCIIGLGIAVAVFGLQSHPRRAGREELAVASPQLATELS